MPVHNAELSRTNLRSPGKHESIRRCHSEMKSKSNSNTPDESKAQRRRPCPSLPSHNLQFAGLQMQTGRAP